MKTNREHEKKHGYKARNQISSSPIEEKSMIINELQFPWKLMKGLKKCNDMLADDSVHDRIF